MSSGISVKADLQWNGIPAIKSIDAQTLKALHESAILVENAAVKNVNQQVYSTPESPDYKRTGALRASITRVITGFRAFVGSALDYALWVEKGTRFQKARPYLLPALILNKGKILSIFKRRLRESKYVN